MNSNIQTLIENINKLTWNSQIRENFYVLQDEIDSEFIPFLENLIDENKNKDITKISLETLNFYRQIMSDKQIKNINELLEKIIKTDSYSLESKKEAIVQRGYFSEWPDLLLRGVLEKSSEEELKIFAFRSILTEMKLPYQVIDLETSLAINGEIEPSFDRINEVTQARADGHFDHLKS
jgi:hypothetical protein